MSARLSAANPRHGSVLPAVGASLRAATHARPDGEAFTAALKLRSRCIWLSADTDTGTDADADTGTDADAGADADADAGADADTDAGEEATFEPWREPALLRRKPGT